MQQVVQLVRTRIDDTQPVPPKMIGIERADEDAHNSTEGKPEGRKMIFIVHRILTRYRHQ
jgi:hypothetical protein